MEKDKLIFYAPKNLDPYGDVTVRVSAEAKDIIKGIAQRVKRSDADIATEMILFAADHVEIEEPQKGRKNGKL